MRKYSHHSPHEILTEVAIHGKSDGWTGSIEEFKSFETFLKKFNVVYTNDFHGRWELKKNIPSLIDKTIEFATEIPPAISEQTTNIGKVADYMMNIKVCEENHGLAKLVEEVAKGHTNMINIISKFCKQ